MDRFSERIGVNPRRPIVQKDNIDEPLANGLWNGLMIFFWERISNEWNIRTPDSVSSLIFKIWVSHFKKRVDELPREDRFLEFIKDYFFRCEWYDEVARITRTLNSLGLNNNNSSFHKHQDSGN
jgi:hypothetical protein